MAELDKQYETVASPPEGAAPNGPPTIDEQSRQAAMARAMVANEKRQREQQCGLEINNAIAEILKRHRCEAHYMELRQDGGTNRIWLQPVAVDEPTT